MTICPLQKSRKLRQIQKHGNPLASRVMELWHLESGSNFKKTAEVQVNVKKLNFNSKVFKNTS